MMFCCCHHDRLMSTRLRQAAHQALPGTCSPAHVNGVVAAVIPAAGCLLVTSFVLPVVCQSNSCCSRSFAGWLLVCWDFICLISPLCFAIIVTLAVQQSRMSMASCCWATCRRRPQHRWLQRHRRRRQKVFHIMTQKFMYMVVSSITCLTQYLHYFSSVLT